MQNSTYKSQHTNSIERSASREFSPAHILPQKREFSTYQDYNHSRNSQISKREQNGDYLNIYQAYFDKVLKTSPVMPKTDTRNLSTNNLNLERATREFSPIKHSKSVKNTTLPEFCAVEYLQNNLGINAKINCPIELYNTNL